jgi:hypothetical protein
MPSNILWHCSNIVQRKFAAKTTNKEIEREKKKASKRERERGRASELVAKWYGNCRKQGTTGWISIIGFARSVIVHYSICLVYAKFNGLPCMVPGYRFWGALSVYNVLCTSLTKNSCNTKMVFNHFDRDSHTHIYIIFIYICTCTYVYIYMYMCVCSAYLIHLNF